MIRLDLMHFDFPWNYAYWIRNSGGGPSDLFFTIPPGDPCTLQWEPAFWGSDIGNYPLCSQQRKHHHKQQKMRDLTLGSIISDWSYPSPTLSITRDRKIVSIVRCMTWSCLGKNSIIIPNCETNTIYFRKQKNKKTGNKLV